MPYIVFGWAAVLVAALVPLSGPWALAGVLAAIVICAFGVMQHADTLALRLGEPYGAVVLTLSVTAIEVILVASVLLGPGHNPTIARDSTVSAAMLLLNLILGLALVLGGVRHGGLSFHVSGASQYVVTLLVLGSVAFVLPMFLDGAVQPIHVGTTAVVTVVIYVVFLYRQLGPNAADFQEPGHEQERDEGPIWPPMLALLATLVPIVILSHVMTPLLNAAVSHTELAGLIIAVVVLFPETLTTLSAGWRGAGQRVFNLTFGALVSVVGATVPVVLLMSVLTGQSVDFVLPASHLTLLGLTLGVSMMTAVAGRATVTHGVAYLAIFAMYVLVLVG